ncbi:MAG: addiction module toxin RelE [Candidatus Altiarchaeales archaeon WOR_SM1_79]|nr:MAG: addiction module toxin RelE [Candidatus Altiarchaeales archaeon WOR_SM1_79]
MDCEQEYGLEISDEANKKFEKLKKKSKKQLAAINKKVQQILETPYRFKPLRGDMFGARRVHIDKSFVLTYEIHEKEKAIRILDYAHHDKIY